MQEKIDYIVEKYNTTVEMATNYLGLIQLLNGEILEYVDLRNNGKSNQAKNFYNEKITDILNRCLVVNDLIKENPDDFIIDETFIPNLVQEFDEQHTVFNFAQLTMNRHNYLRWLGRKKKAAMWKEIDKKINEVNITVG